eukprot:GEMP01047701.1.p1 GENE.GEMP01047701.1~~GEMP01047701.1.p1  ORF type:complete len:425 (-),score=124.32 GEMP01047701.1:399-1673(-)
MSGDVPDAEATLGDRIFVMLGPAEEENAVLRMCLAEARAMIEPLQAHNESLACQLLEGPKTQVGVSEALDSEQLYVEREALQCELEYALESQSSYYLYREKSLLKELSMTVQQLGQLQIVLRAREKVAAQCSAQLDEEGARVEREKLNAEQWKNEASVHLAAAHDWKLEERRLAEDAVKKVKQSMTLQLNAERKKQERLRSSIVAERRQLRQFFKGEKDQVTYDKELVESEVRMSRSELTQANQVSMLLEDEKATALQEVELWQQNVWDLTMHYASKTNAIPARTPMDGDARKKKDPVAQPLRKLTLEVTLNTVLRLRYTNMLRTAFDAWVDMKHREVAHLELDAGLHISTFSALDLPGWPKSPLQIPHRYAGANGSNLGASRRSASEMSSLRRSAGEIPANLRHSRHSFGDLYSLRASAGQKV